MMAYQTGTCSPQSSGPKCLHSTLTKKKPVHTHSLTLADGLQHNLECPIQLRNLKPRNRTCFHGRVDSERRTSKRTILAAAQAIHAADADAATIAVVHEATLDVADRHRGRARDGEGATSARLSPRGGGRRGVRVVTPTEICCTRAKEK